MVCWVTTGAIAWAKAEAGHNASTTPHAKDEKEREERFIPKCYWHNWTDEGRDVSKFGFALVVAE